MSTLKTTNIAHPSSASNNIVLDSSGNVVLQAGTAAAPALQPTGDTNTGVLFPAADTVAISTGGSERARCDSAGRLLVGTTTATANGGVLQVSNGITFPATQSACSDANTLDDYEEGTWTPELADASSGGNLFTHSVQNGLYTKIGNVVTVYFRVTWTSKGSATAGNYVFLRGFPFAAKSNNGGYYYTGTIVPRNGQITVFIEGGQSRGLFVDSSGGYGIVSEFSASDTAEGVNGCFTYLA